QLAARGGVHAVFVHEVRHSGGSLLLGAAIENPPRGAAGNTQTGLLYSSCHNTITICVHSM
ncbi:MAG: hypothetical protein ACLU6D_12080, partial [Gordonibacter urolithinfaciens]